MDKPKKIRTSTHTSDAHRMYNQAITDYEAYLEDFIEDITGICVDYDGYKTVKGLKGLIDDIKDYSIKRLGKND